MNKTEKAGKNPAKMKTQTSLKAWCLFFVTAFHVKLSY